MKLWQIVLACLVAFNVGMVYAVWKAERGGGR